MFRPKKSYTANDGGEGGIEGEVCGSMDAGTTASCAGITHDSAAAEDEAGLPKKSKNKSPDKQFKPKVISPPLPVPLLYSRRRYENK